MLHTYTATDHRDLVRAWMHHLRHHPPTHPFDPLTVVVPNMDMARWLQLHLADATGFAGNLHFTLPAAWLRTRFEAANPRVKQLLLDKTHLQWMMFEILSGTNDPTAPWSHVQSWISRIADRASGTSDALAKARWDIATQLADAFDQYIMYRPDWLLAWQGQTIPAEDALGPLPTGPESLWQAALWREVVRRWPDIPNRATLLYQFLADQTRPAPASDETLLLPGSKTFTEIIPSPYSDETTPVSVTASSPGRIYAYGLSTLPLPTMLAMARHARNTEWHWFAQRHPISEESYLRELNSYTSDQNGAFREILVREGVAGTHTDVDPGARPGTHPAARPGTHPAARPAARPANNLRRLQHTALHDTPFQPEASDPAAIRLHACHSARREVEVLYDTILDLFNTTDVRPGDIAIVTPDPDAYRPFIEEIFRGGGIPDGIQPALHVAGARRNPADIGAEVMLGALNLIGTRYKVPEVLDWLEAEPVLGTLTDRSGLRHTLHNWVLRQRIRWGIDARQLIRAGFPLSGRHTWRHGIDRLLLSWLASEGEDIAVGEILTGSTVAGQDTGILLGRLAAVIQALSDLQEASESPATLAEWCTILEQFTSEVFTLSEAGRTYAASVQKALFQLRLTAQMLRLDQPMAFPVVRSHLETALSTTGLGRAWRPGTITFTGMVALHQIPFRVVAILGLNDGKLPGKTPVSAFDLIPEFPRPADRSRREADRQLFLDYLLTPDLHLHLSYTGMRQKDNKDLAPSVMLTMLEDFIAEKLPADRRDFLKNLRVNHSLQPFSPKYFTAEDAPSHSDLFTSEDAPSRPGSDSPDTAPSRPDPQPGLSNTALFSYSRKNRDLAAALNAPRTPRQPLFPVVEPSVAGLRSTAFVTDTRSKTDESQPMVNTPSAMPLSAATVLTPRELTLHDLQQFFRNPVKALLRQRPGLSLDEAEVPSESAEPFAFDSLTGWQVRSQVMRNWLETGDMAYDVIETHLRRDGILAEGQAGRRQMRVLVAELQDFIAYFAAQTGDNPRFSVLTADVDVTTASGNTYRIAAMHPYMHAGTAWNFEAGKGGSAIPASKRFRHYLTHLVLNYVQPVQSRTIFRDQKELIYRAMPSELARLRLGNILSVYETGISRPIPFFPGCMLVYLKALRDGMVTQAAHELLLETLSEEPGSHPSEAEMELDNVWVREAYGDVHPLAVETGRHLCGLSDLRQPLKVSDFDTSDLFTLMATRIIDAMKADTETSATQDTSDGANPDVAGGAPSADQAAAAKSTEDPE
jgi:exonuclease V gamma subunit